MVSLRRDINSREKPLVLSELSAGEKAQIQGFIADSLITQRMEEMGIIPGEEVEYVKSAPLGDPMEIQVKGYMLSLRREEAALVKINRIEQSKFS